MPEIKLLEFLKNVFHLHPVGLEPDPELEAANLFWAEARSRVLEIANAHGLHLTLAEHDDGFLFDLYDYGERIPTEAEVVEAIWELTEA